MKKWSWLVAPAIVIALAAMPAHAAKRGGQTSTSSIALAGGANFASIQPHLKGAVTFNTTVGSLAGWEYPMIDVSCTQNGVTVFAQLDKPDATFLLGGGSSDWLTNGGPATCRADLDAYGSKGGSWSVRILASTSFDAQG
jgi:hypothetical protein